MTVIPTQMTSSPEPDEVLVAPSTGEFHEGFKRLSTWGSAMAGHDGAPG